MSGHKFFNIRSSVTSRYRPGLSDPKIKIKLTPETIKRLTQSTVGIFNTGPDVYDARLPRGNAAGMTTCQHQGGKFNEECTKSCKYFDSARYKAKNICTHFRSEIEGGVCDKVVLDKS